MRYLLFTVTTVLIFSANSVQAKSDLSKLLGSLQTNDDKKIEQQASADKQKQVAQLNQILRRLEELHKEISKMKEDTLMGK